MSSANTLTKGLQFTIIVSNPGRSKSDMVIILCLIFIFFSLVISKIIARTIMTPLGIFGTVWNGLLILFELRFVKYSPISVEAYVLLLGSYALFFVGAVTVLWGAVMATQGSRYAFLKDLLKRPACNLGTLCFFIYFYGAISVVGFCVWAYKIWLTGGFAVFRSAASFRSLQLNLIAEGILGYMISIGLACALLGGMYLAYGGKRKVSVCLTLLPLLGYSTISGARALAIWTFLLFISPLLLIIGQKSSSPLQIRSIKKITLGIGMVLVMFFIAIGYSRGIVQQTGEHIGSYVNINLPPALLHIYIYITGPFAAFSWLLNSWTGGNLFFASVLTPLAKLLDLVGIYTLNFGLLASRAYIPFSFTARHIGNTYTYLAGWYIDFGLLGAIIGPYSLGVISTYLAMRSAYRHPIAFAWASFFLTYLIFAFIGSITSENALWIALIGTMLGIHMATAHGKESKQLGNAK